MGSVWKPGIGEVWAVGLGFRPTDDELIDHHLRRKLCGLEEACRVIPELDIYRWEPQALFEKYDEMSDLPSDGRECFFYCVRNGKNRKTRTGFWKGIGKKHTIWGRDGEEIGFKSILVYHEGRQPYGRKSPFSMHQYHLNCRSKPTVKGPSMEIVLCRIINKGVKKINPDSPSSECIDPDLDTVSGAAANQGNIEASPPVCAPLNLTEEETKADNEDGSEIELLQYYESICNEHDKFTYNDPFRVVDGSNTVNYSDYGLDDGVFISELWG